MTEKFRLVRPQPRFDVLLFLIILCFSFQICRTQFLNGCQGIEAQSEPSSPADRLRNDEILWDSRKGGFGARPIVEGDNARSILKRGIDYSAELIPLLRKEDAFVAAHVLLTEVWRVHRLDKEMFSQSIYRGYFIAHNGLNVRLTWEDHMGHERAVVTIPDLECQMSLRIRAFWETRYRDFPAEFSSKTKVD